MTSLFNRRAALKMAGSSAMLSLAGCITDGEFEPDIDEQKQLGEASGISFEVEPNRDYEYMEESNQVRIHFDGGDSTTMPFETFGVRRAAHHGSDQLEQILEANSVDGTGIGTGQGRVNLTEIDESPNGEDSLREEFNHDPLWGPKVYHTHYYTRNGRLQTEPAVPFEDIVAVVPRYMEVTVLFPERSYTVRLPVICKKSWSKDE